MTSIRPVEKAPALRSYLLAAVCALCALGINSAAQSWKTIKPGLEYAQVTKEINGLNVNINLLRMDLTKMRVDLVHSYDRAIGMDTTSSIASAHKALAAINAGFFRLDTSQWAGDPVGIMQIDGRLLSEPTNDRIELLINNGPRKTDVYIARPTYTTALRFGQSDFDVKGINREVKADDCVILTPEFGPTTLTRSDTLELIMTGRMIGSMVRDIGNSQIPRDGFVIAATGSYREKLEKLASTEKYASVVRTAQGLPPGAEKVLEPPNEWDIIAGVPQLIHDGQVDITWQREKTSLSFVET